MSVKIYIAGASKEPERVRAAMTAATKLGLEITLDWLAIIEKEGAANEGLDNEKRLRFSRADLDAVHHADWIWLLAPSESPSSGCWVELGYALALYDMRSGRGFPYRKGLGLNHPRIIVSGVGRMKCIFCSLAEREFDGDFAALGYLAAETQS